MAAPKLPSRPMEEISLAQWALHSMREGRTRLIVDRFLEGRIMPECLHRYAETAKKCLKEKSAGRPPMTNVVSSLELAFPQQVSAKEEEEKSSNGTYFVDFDGDEDDDGSSSPMSSTPCQTDEGVCLA
ncbi:hypothetical protein EJ110_NYTH02239 [Nymphaea thermarum]|nr:hypothetical protein EJ110_NYTH02239 [Nymphaea thermarum]